MANQGAIRAGKAYVELYADKSELVRALRSADKEIKVFADAAVNAGKGLSAIGMAGLSGLVASAKIFANMGSDMNDLSIKTGISTETLSAWKLAADQSGGSVEQVSGAVSKLSKAIFEANNGSKTAKDAFVALGLSLDSISGMSPEQQFRVIAQALAGVENPTKKAALAMEIFGKSGAELLPFIDQLKDSEQAARNFGLTISASAAKAADQLGDSLTVLWASAKMVTFEIGAAMAPAVESVSQSLTKGASALASFVRENQSLVTTAAGTLAVIAGLGGVFLGLGVALKGLSMAIAAAIAGFKSLIGITAICSGAIKALGVSLAWALANPVLAGLAAIGALIAGIAAYVALTSKNTKDLADEMERLRESGNTRRRDDTGYGARLSQLGSKDRLSTSQLAEAQSIIDILTKRYGDLGVAIDSVGGKIQGLEGFQERLNDAMKATAIAELDNQIKAYSEQINELLRQKAIIQKQGPGYSTAGVDAQIAEIQQKIDAANIQKQSTMSGDTTPTGQSAVESLQQNLEDVNKQEMDWANRVAQLKTQLIDDQYQREMAQIDAKYQAEMDKARQLLTDAGVKAEDQESNPLIARIAEARAIEQSVLERKLANDSAEFQATWESKINELRMSNIEDRWEKERALMNAYYDEEIRKAKLAGQDTGKIEEARQEALAGWAKQKSEALKNQQSEVDKMNLLASKPQGLEQELAGLKFDMQKELEDASKNGLDQDLIRQKYDLLAQNAVFGTMSTQTQQMSQGTFNPYALDTLGDSSTYEKQIIETNKSMLEKLDEIKRVLAENGWSY
jgi:hypothetical protein